MKKVIKVLSIDGGGIRGIIPAIVLAAIEEKLTEQMGQPVAISEMFDLIAGTSTGGILALALTKPDQSGKKPEYSAKNLVDFYEQEGPKIFAPTTFAKIREWVDEKYPATGIDTVLEKYFGDTMLNEALTEVLIPSYEIEQRRPYFFKSQKAKKDPKRNFLMKHIARATTAAPTYFEPLQLKADELTDYYALIDGGVVANNPALCAFVEAKTIFPEAEKFLVVSVGTGELTTRLFYEDVKDWGLLQWAQPILHVVFDGSSDTVDYQLRELLQDQNGEEYYYRFQTSLGDLGDRIDDATDRNILALKRLSLDLINYKQEKDLSALCRHLGKCMAEENT